MMDTLLSLDKNLRIGILLFGFFVSFALMPFVENAWFVFFILGFVFLGTLIKSNVMYDNRLREQYDQLAKETLAKNNFDFDDFHIGDDKLSAIAINESKQTVAIVQRNSIKVPFSYSLINFKDVIESQIIEDGETTIKSSKGSMIGGALTGSLIAGNIGAAIGGLNSTKISKEKVKKISLLIVIDNLINPVFEVNYLNAIDYIDKSNPLYKNANSKVYKWHKMMSVILKRNEMNSNSI